MACPSKRPNALRKRTWETLSGEQWGGYTGYYGYTSPGGRLEL
jgi:hypothetical protein